MSWDKAQKIYSGERTSWDDALEIYRQDSGVETAETPDEAHKTGVDIQDMSIKFEIPIDEIDANYDTFALWDIPADPSSLSDDALNYNFVPNIEFLKKERPSFKAATAQSLRDLRRRPKLPANALPIEKFDRVLHIIADPALRIFYKLGKGMLLNSPDAAWAGIKKIIPEDMQEIVEDMTLDDAVDWAMDYNPGAVADFMSESAEFVGGLSTIGKMLPAVGKGLLPQATRKAVQFGGAKGAREAAKLTAELVDPDTSYGFEGAQGVVIDMAVGAGLSFLGSAAKPIKTVISNTAFGQAVEEGAHKAAITLTRNFPLVMDSIRRDPQAHFTKQVLRVVRDQTGKTARNMTLTEKAAVKHVAREGERRFLIAYRNYLKNVPPDIVQAVKRRGVLLPKPPTKPVAAPVAPTAPTPPPTAAKPAKPTVKPLKPLKALKALKADEVQPPIEAKRVIDTIEYKLFQGDRGPTVRVFDTEADEMVSLTVYPTQEKAQIAFDKAIQGAKKVAPPPDVTPKQFAEVAKIKEGKPIGKTAAFEAYQKAMPNATEEEIVKALLQDDLLPTKKLLEKYADLPEVKDALADLEIEHVAATVAVKEGRISKKVEDFWGKGHMITATGQIGPKIVTRGIKGVPAIKGKELITKLFDAAQNDQVSAEDFELLQRSIADVISTERLRTRAGKLSKLQEVQLLTAPTFEDVDKEIDRVIAEEQEAVPELPLERVGRKAVEKPVLTSATQRGSIIYMQFDSTAPIPSVEELKKFLSLPDASISVGKKAPGFVSTIQGGTNFQINVSKLSGPDSSALAQKVFNAKIGPGNTYKAETALEQALPLKERFARVAKAAVGAETGVKPPEPLPPVSPRPLVDPHATALEQDTQRRAQQKWDKKHPGGKIDITPLANAHNLFMSIIEPSKAVEIAQGKDVYAEVIKAVHKADVAMIDFNEKQLENLDSTLGEWGKALSKYSNRTLELLMLSRGKPASKEAILIRDEALEELAKKAPELVGTRKMITRASDFNYDYLAEVVGDQINYIEDYFYGIYKDPRRVEKFLDHWKTTKRFTKEKKLPTVADAKAFGLDLRDPNPVNNLRSEYLAIARLEGMIDLKTSLLKSGEGDYIAVTADAPIEWDKVHDPVFADVRVAPELAKMINNLISTNKITRIPLLNTIRQVNNFLRTIKFIGSAFHLGVEAKQSMADSGYLGFLHKPTTTRGLTRGFRQGDPLFQTPEYKDYIAHGGGHRYSIDSEAQRAFSNAVDKINEKLAGTGKAIKGAAFVGTLPEKFVKWMFENYIPKVKYSKYQDTLREQEVKLGRSLTSAEKIDIVKEAQNFYGMMNERLFGRSGTVTTILRFKFMAPGFAEGNFRTILKAVLQWGGNEGFSAHRSRANIINSFIISAIAATVGTIFLTGKPPKKPEKIADIRDLFKIDTGKVDQHGRPIMIDMLTYDKDYWDVFGNLATGQPAEAIETTVKRLGGMTATTWDVISDLNQMSMGRAIYDWKSDRVVEVTDPFIQKVLKLSIHELKKAEPISTNVFHQARKKGVGVALSAAMTLAGVRLTKTEQDKKEVEILHKIFSLRDQQETLFWYLGTIKNPREQIKKYNQTVMRILDNPITPLEVKDEYEPKLIIDEKRLTANKVYNFLGDQAKLAELSRSPEKHQKEIKELQDDNLRSSQWLRNFEITEKQYRKHLVDYEELHRKIVKEIQPEDDLDGLKKDLARFYADQTILKRKIQSGIGTEVDRRKARRYAAISNNIAEIARRIYDTENEGTRDSLFVRIESVMARSKE